MLLHYFRIAWRHIRNHKLYSFINVLGLALGICACTVIFLVARFDLSFDTFHPDASRIYRIVGEAQRKDGETIFVNSPFPEIAGIEHAIPGFEAQVGFHTFGETVTIPAEKGGIPKEFSGKQDGSYATSIILTGPTFFQIFPHQWLIGNPDVLTAPDRVVLAESAARKYFGTVPLDKIIGRTVIYDDSLPLTVAGIVRDWDKLSDLNYTNFISLSTAPSTWLSSRFPTTDWSSLQPHRSQAFVKLAKTTDIARVNAALAQYVKEHPIGFLGEGAHFRLFLQPLSALHYTPDFHRGDDGDDFRKAWRPLLYALSAVALFILALAVINFINLSTAQSLQRVKEVGIRKVMGSSRKGLIRQFLVETLLLTGSAVILAILLVRPALALFIRYIPAEVRFSPFETGNLLFLFVLLTITTFLAGFYPARLLSSYLPVLSLKGVVDKTRNGSPGLRKTLIVFQFTISLIFIIGSLAVARQIRFMRDADKGFNSDAIVTVNKWRAQTSDLKLFAQAVKKLAGVRSVIVEGNAPMGFAHGGANFIYRGKKLKDMMVSVEAGDASFIPFYGMKVVAGRNMIPGDSVREVVINETYSRLLGFSQPEAALGSILFNNEIGFTVVGVVRDFHEDSFRETIKPVIIQSDPAREKSVAIKLVSENKQAGDTKKILAAMETEWKKVFPKSPFQYSFLNESITWLYDQETHAAWLMQAAMVITIFISCMGLFGLALFTAGRRAKEIGIRKVLGASVAGISMLLSKDFLSLVMIALAIAAPIAWYFTDQWLGSFAYRTAMSAWVLVEAGLAAIGIALLTIGYQSVRAALANPVKSLRTE
jgi:ABC-type antimicrobial peptide transport system permease subunit